MATKLDFLIPEMQATLAAQQHNATGAGSASLTIESDKDGYIIKGVGYLYWVNFGRKAGKFPPIDRIRAWVELKGIASGKAVKSVAFLIGRAIMRRGTLPDWQGTKRRDFITDTIARNNDKIIEAIGGDFQGIVFEKFNKEAQEANKL